MFLIYLIFLIAELLRTFCFYCICINKTFPVFKSIKGSVINNGYIFYIGGKTTSRGSRYSFLSCNVHNAKLARYKRTGSNFFQLASYIVQWKSIN